MAHTLRVASYNLRDFKEDAAAAARVVRAINPDVLCLQEVPRHLLSSNQVATFAARCGLYWPAGHRGSGGTTMMSSLRVLAADTEHRSLRVARLARQRGYTVGRIQLPGCPLIRVVSLHLSLDATERASHVATVLGTLSGDGPMVVAGDLNEGSEGRAWRILAGQLNVVTDDTPTFPATNPHRRIDVIFASRQLAVVPSGALALSHADLVAATDHLPVWVDLDLSSLALA